MFHKNCLIIKFIILKVISFSNWKIIWKLKIKNYTNAIYFKNKKMKYNNIKYILPILMIMFLAGCSNNTNNENSDLTWNLNQQINQETEKVWENTNENALKEISAEYKNPKTTVDMTIKYKLDENWKIDSLSVNASTFDISKFKKQVEEKAIWKTLKEASWIYVSWQSLTSKAFQDAIKSQL